MVCRRHLRAKRAKLLLLAFKKVQKHSIFAAGFYLLHMFSYYVLVNYIGNCNFDALNNVLKQKFFYFIFTPYATSTSKSKQKRKNIRKNCKKTEYRIPFFIHYLAKTLNRFPVSNAAGRAPSRPRFSKIPLPFTHSWTIAPATPIIARRPLLSSLV